MDAPFSYGQDGTSCIPPSDDERLRLYALLQYYHAKSSEDYSSSNLLHALARVIDTLLPESKRTEAELLKPGRVGQQVQQLFNPEDVSYKNCVDPYEILQLDDSDLKAVAKESEGRQQRVLKEITDGGKVTSSAALAQLLQVTSRTILNDLKVLEKAGLVERVGSGKNVRWALKTGN